MENEKRVVGPDEAPVELREHDRSPLPDLGPRDLEELGASLPAGISDLERTGLRVAREPQQGRDDAQKYAEARHFRRVPG